jgi:uncharacterized Zn-binding protein involved in type VI secretion
MGQPAAKKGDTIRGMDMHLVTLPNGAQARFPFAFQSIINEKVSTNVRILGAPAAMKGSQGKNTPEHKVVLLAQLPGADFVIQPNNEGTIAKGSKTVNINGKPAARNSDTADTCRDAPSAPALVVATGSVLIG